MGEAARRCGRPHPGLWGGSVSKRGKQPETLCECYICGRSVLVFERDHFPVSKCLDGILTREICRDCHDLKDRLPINRWDPVVAFGGLMTLWSKADRDERLILAHMFHVMNGQAAFIRQVKDARHEK